MEYLTIPGVEIASVGMKWPTASGALTVRLEHLQDAMEAANNDPHVVPPRLKIGHSDPRFNSEDDLAHDHDPSWDGEPAVGVVRNLRLTNDGATLVGDYEEVPDWLAQALPSAYPNRSMEGSWSMAEGPAGEPMGTWDWETPGGKKYSLVITAVALLGVSRPAILDLEDLRRFLVAGEGLVVAGSEPKGGVAASGNIDGVKTQPAAARADVDKVLDLFCSEFAAGDRYWWWPRSVWTEPNEIVADDNEGSLWRIGFSSDEQQRVTFDEPTRVLETFVDAPAARAALLAVAAAKFDDEGNERRPAASFATRSDSPARAAVTDNAWDGSPARFSDAEYARACILDRADCGEGDLAPKQRYSVPVKEPDGTINRNGCHTAAGGRGIGATKACAKAKERAAKRLVSIYRNDLEEEPPDSLMSMAGMAAPAAAQGGVGDSAIQSGMDAAAELRKVLGLAEDASDDEVQTALAAREGGEEQEGSGNGEAGDGEPAGGDGGEEQTGGDGSTEPAGQTEPVAASTVTMDAATAADLRRKAEAGAQARAEQIRDRRERLIARAVEEGKFAPARAGHYRQLHESDPEGTESMIEGLAAGLVPVEERGSSADPARASATAVTDEEMVALFGVHFRRSAD